MAVWREQLRLSSELLDQSSHAAIDATYFDRREASSHYLRRCDRDVGTVQATFLVDTAQGAVIDVHCSAKWPSGTNVGPQSPAFRRATCSVSPLTRATMI